jgi:NDP-sugar pyrophosphorylase family protein
MNVENLRCFIPVGGPGRRLMPLTKDVSKPCIRLLNRPLIEFSMATLAEQGVRNFIFGVNGYNNYTDLFDQYGEGVGFSAKYGIRPRAHIKYQPNLDDLGSADSYRLNMNYYDVRDPVLVTMGDNIFNINLKNLIKAHEDKGALITIGVTSVEKTEEYGVAVVDEDLRIKTFVEKPPTNKAHSKLANTGLYLFSPDVRKIAESPAVEKILEEEQRLDFGFDFLPYCVKQDFPVYAFELTEWHDAGAPERYLQAMHDVLYGKLNIRVSEEPIFPGRRVWVQGYSEESIKHREEIVRKINGKKLLISGATLVGRHTRVGDNSKIVDSNIDNFCILGEHVDVEGSAIMDAAKIGDHARISNSILGRKVVVESSRSNPTCVESTSVIGNNVRIGPGCRIVRTRINPGLQTPMGMTYVDQYLEDYEDVVHLATH